MDLKNMRPLDKKMEKNIKPFGWRRNLDYLFILYYLSKQKMKEYKIDFFSMMFFDFFLLTTYMISYFVIGGLVFSFLHWNIGDFFLLFCFTLLAWKILWVWGLRNFAFKLLKGNINVYLLRPINIYFSASVEGINFQNLISGLGLFIIAIIYIIYSKIYIHYLLAFFIFIFGCTFLMVFVNFLESFAFIFKKNEFLQNIFVMSDEVVSIYTPKTFESSSFRILFYLFPAAFGYFMVEVLNNRLEQFYYYLPYLILIFIFLSFGIYLLWYYGLKNYEGFG